MVTGQQIDDQLQVLAKAELGEEPLNIYITGGTGFVGSRLARVLCAAGHRVTVSGRNPHRHPIASLPIQFDEVDLTDRQRILDACQNRDLVFHIGAKSSPWGTKSEFRSANVDGTQNVVDGCLLHRVPRLIHVSSTAIHFEFIDKLGISETDPLPMTFCSEYAQSKADAEKVVQTAVDKGLNAIILRARAVFGPGDNTLLPRLIEAARQGRLKQIGSGQNRIDLTYIDNLIAALLLAVRRGDAGTVCTVTNGEPILLWPLLRETLDSLNISSKLPRVPQGIAMLAARFLEWQHRFMRRPGEPVMTRYAVGLLSRSQTFDISTARRVLGFSPIVTMNEGIQRTLNMLTGRDESNAVVAIKLRLFSTGFTAHPAHLAESGAARGQVIRFHAMFGLIEHPTQGLTLFDAGYSPRFYETTRRFPYSIYGWTTPARTNDALSAISVLRRNGIDPSLVRRIVLSHFHADHVCGLKDFPQAEIITSSRAWLSVQGKSGLGAVKRAIIPELFPDDIKRRLRLIEAFQSPGFGPFEATHDLFGDGSVRMVELSGHALGQIGLLLQQDSGRCLLAADAAWTGRTIRENLPLTFGFQWLAASAREARESLRKLHEFHKSFPSIEIIPTHCPEVADRYGFNAEVDRLLAASTASERSACTTPPTGRESCGF